MLKLDVDDKPASVGKLPLDASSPRQWNKAEIGETPFAKPGGCTGRLCNVIGASWFRAKRGAQS